MKKECPHCKLEMTNAAWGKFSRVLICYICNYFITEEGEEKALDEI